MILKNYQKSAIDKLLKVSKKLLSKDGHRICVLKAPTGSGKTIILADFLTQFASDPQQKGYAFIWISGNDLHTQSRKKLEKYLADSRYTFSYLEDIQSGEFKENEIVFVNWHSLTKQDRKTGAYTNVFMRDNESDQNLQKYIENTKENGLKIILIVDESHYHYWSPKSQELVQGVISPSLTFEISATPKLEPTAEDISNEDAGFVSVKFDEVVSEGMIKSEVVINKEIGEYTKFNKAADEVILAAAMEKREELKELYTKLGVDVNPLVLVQLPNESQTTSALDKTKLEFVEAYMKKNYKIDRENGLFGTWLSGDTSIDKDEIVNNTDKLQVLVFKQAIALGWDCPRAQILVMFRDIKSTTFEIQTVGRILRMPEVKHYEIDELNRAFVYTNLDKVQIGKDDDSQRYFQINPAHRIQNYTQVKLPSVYLSRLDYGDLTLAFRKHFIEEANSYFGIKENDFPHDAKEKADIKLDLLPSELTQAVISDVVLSNLDNVEDIIGKQINFPVPEDDLKYKFELFAKAMSLPFAPSRSHTKIQQALYDWFDKYLGYQDSSRLEIQRIVVCSEINQKIFKEIIETAKEKFRETKRKETEAKQSKRETVWDVPPIDYFNELYIKQSASNYAQDACYLLENRSEPEKLFEEVLNSSNKIEWWYKNGVGKESYFAIEYNDSLTGLSRAFYPDYIVLFKDGSVGIYDTKFGMTAESSETKDKSDAVVKYLNKNSSSARKLIGGIVASIPSGLYVFNGKKYTSNYKNSQWIRFDKHLT